MPITVTGSVAFDSVRTPFGERERMLGGTAVHFALAASFFDEVHVVGSVGDDFGRSSTRCTSSARSGTTLARLRSRCYARAASK
jgi:hypothetical protein